jgi:aminobenzoyl-glutamate utilization protein B
MNSDVAKEVARITSNGELAINNFVAPLYTGDAFMAGSTDVGDVSWQTPAAQLYAACFTSGAPGHSWQNVSAGKSPLGHKGLILAAKVLASSAVELYENPELILKAREEFSERSAGGYVCPIPDGEYAKPVEL